MRANTTTDGCVPSVVIIPIARGQSTPALWRLYPSRRSRTAVPETVTISMLPLLTVS